MNNDWKVKYGRYALITGASGGLGAEFARQLAARGMDLILVARNKEKLEGLSDEISRQYKVNTSVILADLTAPGAVAKLVTAMGPAADELGLLVNNAGFGSYGLFHELPLDRELEQVDLNMRVPTELTGLLLPAMVQRGRGGVIFLGSVASYQPAPFFATYAASKAWNLMFGEALYGELKPKGIDVIVLTPGYTRTEFQKIAGNPDQKALAGWMDADVVVRTALKNLGRKPSVIPGFRNWLLAESVRFTPRKWMIAIAYRLLRP